MLSAELRGKLPRGIRNLEDVLTSYVFNFLQYSSRPIFLGRFLHDLAVGVSEADLEAAEFRFWPTFPDGTEPDLVIVRVLVKGRKNGRGTQVQIDLIDRFDEATGFTAMERTTGWDASIKSIMNAHRVTTFYYPSNSLFIQSPVLI